jgi:hypothetical protein
MPDPPEPDRPPEPEPRPEPPPCPDRGPIIDRNRCRTYYCFKFTRVVGGGECVRCAASGFTYSG